MAHLPITVSSSSHAMAGVSLLMSVIEVVSGLPRSGRAHGEDISRRSKLETCSVCTGRGDYRLHPPSRAEDCAQLCPPGQAGRRKTRATMRGPLAAEGQG